MNKIENFNIKNKNILQSFEAREYLYSKTYNRIYKRVGNINFHKDYGGNEIPTILVDTDGGSYDFVILKEENTYEVLSVPDKFSYKEYSIAQKAHSALAEQASEKEGSLD